MEHKATVWAIGALLIVAIFFWLIAEVADRPQIYLPTRVQELEIIRDIFRDILLHFVVIDHFRAFAHHQDVLTKQSDNRLAQSKFSYTLNSEVWLLSASVHGWMQIPPEKRLIYGESLFLTLPKFKNQNGYSLAQSTSSGILPFPSYTAHKNGTIVNAVDIFLDSNGTLWVLDSGMIDTFHKPIKKGPPKVVCLDADSGKILKEINMTNLVKGKAQYLIVDESAKGPKYLYISDGPARSIIVWNIDKNKGHVVLLPKIVHKRKGFNILYASLIDKKLYLTYFGSSELFYLKTSGLFENGRVVRVGFKDPRMIILGTRNHEIIFRLAGRSEILAWDTRTKLIENNLQILDKGNHAMDPLAVVHGYGRLWLLESNLKDFLNGTQNKHNFRLLN